MTSPARPDHRLGSFKKCKALLVPRSPRILLCLRVHRRGCTICVSRNAKYLHELHGWPRARERVGRLAFRIHMNSKHMHLCEKVRLDALARGHQSGRFLSTSEQPCSAHFHHFQDSIYIPFHFQQRGRARRATQSTSTYTSALHKVAGTMSNQGYSQLDDG